MDHLAEDGHLGRHLGDGPGELLILHLDPSELAGKKGILSPDALLFFFETFHLLSFSLSG